eukprot:TRINITY_DN2193_c0_g1_i1.p1 TRINITY_DN2193_c0_g1~~TRINITY_DN2193_c0_g1_i1.p1  ORF type:complete len:594 (+),score=234.74 TRINITY_DN2193_c0_g1_i1:52-1833(+)
MVKRMKKGERGHTSKFVTRRKAIRELRLSLGEFRKLCILKGIHPRDPNNKSRNTRQVSYHRKDISFLKYEPLINHFRQVSATRKKLPGYSAKGKIEQLKKAQEEIKQLPSLAPILKERYPEFKLALRDLDDALTTLHLFAGVTAQNEELGKHGREAARLVREFDWYVIKTRSLSKAFISIKGYYYQTFVEGQNVTWLVPHKFKTEISRRYPAVIYNSFVDFYKALMSFVLYKLYHDAGLKYPPVLDQKKEDDSSGLDALLVEYDDTKTPKERKIYIPKTKAEKDSIKRIKTLNMKALTKLDEEKKTEEQELIEIKEEPIDDEEQKRIFEGQKEKIENQSRLFEGMKVFISREVPRHPVEFVLLSFGAQISYEGPSAPFPETDRTITHQIVDRDFQRKKYLDRVYIQPQWIFDCANEKLLIPPAEYYPGKNLPPHLSPFAPNFVDGYQPRRREQLDRLKQQLEENGFVDSNTVVNEPLETEYETVNPNAGLTEEEIYQKEMEAEKSGKSFSQALDEEKNRPKKRKDPFERKPKALWETPAPHTVLTGSKRWLFKRISAQQKFRKKRVEQLIYRRNKIEEEERLQAEAKTQKTSK